MSSILGLISRRIAPKFRLITRRSFCSGDRELLRTAAPCLMLPSSFLGGGKMVYNFYSPTHRKVVSLNNRGGKEEADLMADGRTLLVGCSHGWLALCRDGHMSLLNPISGRRIELPPFAGKAFEEGWCPWKVILSSSPKEEDWDALMIIGPTLERAAICGANSKEWIPLGEWPRPGLPERNYIDFVHSATRKRFLGIVQSNLRSSSTEELEGWEISVNGDQRMDELNKLSEHEFKIRRDATTNSMICHIVRYLVHEEQSDQLFLVRRYQLMRTPCNGKHFIDHQRDAFDVYRIDQSGGMEFMPWSLDDLAMFIGINHSFAVKASRFPGLKANSIYFSDARHPYLDDSTCQCVEIFDYQNRTTSPVCYPSRNLDNTIPMPWITPTFED